MARQDDGCRLGRTVRAGGANGRGPAVCEALENRLLLAVTTLSNGLGDGSLRIGVDAYGSYGSATAGGQAIYDPIGPIGPSSTTFDSGLYFSPLGHFLSQSMGSGLPSVPFVSTTSSTALSRFTIAGFHIELFQEITPIAERSEFHQHYTFTNNTGEFQEFILVRHVDGDMYFIGGLGDDFGGVSEDGNFVFQFDAGPSDDVSAFLGITSSGGERIGYTVQRYNYKPTIVSNGTIPPHHLNQIHGDNDGDRMTDFGYDVTISMADRLALAPGESATFTTITVFGAGRPMEIIGHRPGQFRFAQLQYFVGEDAGVAEITVQRVNGSSGEVTVEYAITGGTAIAGTHYTPVSGTLVFADGQSEAVFSIPIIDNEIFDGDRTVELTLLNPSEGSTLTFSRRATLNILDNESGIEFSAASYHALETDGVAVITVTRSAAIGVQTINYSTSDGTATAGLDYLAASGTLTFEEGQLTATFQVPILEDRLFEPTETVLLTLSDPGGTGAFLGERSVATLFIHDVDIYSPTVVDATFTSSGRWIDGITLTFSEPMNAHTTGFLSNYAIFATGGRGEIRPVPIRTVTYDPNSHSVTLHTEQRLRANTLFQVRALSKNVTDQAGNQLDGNHTDTAGGTYLGLLGHGRRLAYTDTEGNLVRLQARRGNLELFAGGNGEAYELRLFNTRPRGSILTGWIHGENEEATTLIPSLVGAENVNVRFSERFIIGNGG